MTTKSYSVPLQNIRDSDGNTHPWYMSGTASIDQNGHIVATTHLESHIALSGFTGGMVAAFMNTLGQSVYTTPLMQYGVDGYDVPSFMGTPSPRDATATFDVDPSVFVQTYTIGIFLFHAPKNRLGIDIQQILPYLEDILTFIATCMDAVYQGGSAIYRSVSPPLMQPLATPVLVSPAEGATFSNYPRTMTLVWQPVPGANAYLAEVQFGDVSKTTWGSAYTNTGANTSVTFNFVGTQPGRWRVTALDTTGINAPSSPAAWRGFVYTVAPLPTPVLVSPPEGAQFSAFPRTTTLTWQAVPGANQYTLEVQYGDASGVTWAPDYNYTGPNTSVTFDFVGDQPGRWRVTASDTTGAHAASPASQWRAFSYVPVPPPPLAVPVQISPADGAQLSGDPQGLVLTWQAVPGATGYRVIVEAGMQVPVLIGPGGPPVGELPVTPGGGVIAPPKPSPVRPVREVWTNVATLSVTGLRTSVTFPRRGLGRWQVVALDSTNAHTPSLASPWWEFTFA